MATALIRHSSGIVYARSISGTLEFLSGGIITLADGSASAPSLAFTNSTTTGLYREGADVIGVATGGNQRIRFANQILGLGASTGISWYDTDAPGAGNRDLVIRRDAAANVLAQRNDTNAQTFRWYRSFTDASNYHRGALATSATGVSVAAETAGTGADNLSVFLTPAGLGHSLTTLGLLMDVRASAAVSADSNQTYTAAQLLGGIVTRTGITANRVDAVDTAANIVAAIPGAVVGTSFDFVVNNNDDASTVTVNGASTGITYEGVATALAAGDAWLFKVFITNVTAASEAATVYQFAK